MHRLSNGTQATVEMAPPAVMGTPGFPIGANPAGGQVAAIIDPWWAVAIQEECCGFVTGLGGALDKTNNGQMIGQLLAAFPGLVPAGRSIGNGAAGSTGYIKLPGGLILQWIRNKAATADNTGAVLDGWTFPVPFQSAVLGYSYVTTNENPGNSSAGVIQAGAPTLTAHPIAHLQCPVGASVAFSGFILGV